MINTWKIKSRILSLILFAGDILSMALSLWLSLAIRYAGAPSFITLQQNFSAFIWIFLIWSLVLYITGFYSDFIIGYRLSLAEGLFKAHLVNVGAAALFFYTAQYYYFIITPKVILILYAVLSYFLLFGWRVFSLSFLQRAVGRGVFYFIGPKNELRELARAFELNPYYSNFKVLAAKALDEIKSGADMDLSLLETRAREGIFSALVAAIPAKLNDELVKKLYRPIFKGVHFFEFQKFYESVFHKIPISLIDEIWFLGNVSSPSRALYDFFKRFVDMAIALTFGAVSLIFYPVIILAIKLDDGGPVFYLPRRVGKNGRIFRLFKFRTMRVDSDARWPQKDDPRVTRVGRFLRRASLDELPQLWNVFLGYISLVGPRPDLIDFAEVLKKEIPYYEIRTLIKPGLTGWAQVSQKLDGDKNPSSVPETQDRLAYDIYYIKNRSFLMDLAIMAKTVRLVLLRIGFLD